MPVRASPVKLAMIIFAWVCWIAAAVFRNWWLVALGPAPYLAWNQVRRGRGGNVFQLVLQFQPWQSGPDEIVALENELIRSLGSTAKVDGHDWGAGEANVFIHCADPMSTFPACVPIVRAAGLLPLLSAAHRPLTGERYTRVWPLEDGRPFEVK
jgi:hypothetical protein